MSEWSYNIFGDRFTSQSVQSAIRPPLCNNENIGKSLKSTSTPVKPNEPFKKATDPKHKKSFLSNTGTALLNLRTPQKALSPRSRNLEASAKKMFSQLIYTDVSKESSRCPEELEFTKPTKQCDDFHLDLLDFLTGEIRFVDHTDSNRTPPPKCNSFSPERDDSFDEDCFIDDFADNGFPAAFDEDELPELY